MIINFADNQDDASIDSEPVHICFCETTESQHDCSYHPQPYQVMKGEKFNVTLVAVNQVNRSVKAVIKIFIPDDSDLGERETVLNSSEQCKNFTFSVKSSRKHEELTIYAESPCYSLGKSRSSVKVIFKNCTCPIGFQKVTDTTRECKCDCDKTLKPYVTCNHLTTTIPSTMSGLVLVTKTSLQVVNIVLSFTRIAPLIIVFLQPIID